MAEAATSAAQPARRVRVQDGGLGGGRLECDGTSHFWVVDDHQALGCSPETAVGPCLYPASCQARAEALAKQKGS